MCGAFGFFSLSLSLAVYICAFCFVVAFHMHRIAINRLVWLVCVYIYRFCFHLKWRKEIKNNNNNNKLLKYTYSSCLRSADWIQWFVEWNENGELKVELITQNRLLEYNQQAICRFRSFSRQNTVTIQCSLFSFCCHLTMINLQNFENEFMNTIDDYYDTMIIVIELNCLLFCASIVSFWFFSPRLLLRLFASSHLATNRNEQKWLQFWHK